MLTVNTPLTLLLVSLTLASEGLHCSTIRCLQALGEKDMVPALYSIPWSDSLPALCGESVYLESEVGRRVFLGFAKRCCSFFVDFHLLCSRIVAGLPRARSARGTEPHTHGIWSISFLLVVT